MKPFVIAAVLGVAALGFVDVTSAQAQGWGPPAYGWGGYNGSWGGYYGAPAYGYYGNGGHDFAPHWHQSTTPYGTYSWYGNGPHDFQPHSHVQTPYSYQGSSVSPWGYTQSFYPNSPYQYSPYPYTYAPW